MAKIEEKVESLIKDKIEKIGYRLYDVLYINESKNYTLRIVIDNKEGITLEDCEKVNNEIMPLLDEADYIKEQYYLEVSSPGVERILRKDWQLKENIGKEIKINLFKKDARGKKEYLGLLEEVLENTIKIKEEEEIEIERKNISQIKTVCNWE